MQILFQQPHVSPPLQVVIVNLVAQAVKFVQIRHVSSGSHDLVARGGSVGAERYFREGMWDC